MIAKLIRSYKKHSNASKRPREAIQGWCPLCGQERLPSCLACKGVVSEQLLQTNVEAFTKRREFANREIMASAGPS